MSQFKYVFTLDQVGGRGDHGFLQTGETRMFTLICVDRVFKQSNEKLNVIPDLCISPTQGRTGRLIKGVTNKLGPK